MNDRQKVALISTGIVAIGGAVWWLLARWMAWLKTDMAFIAILPLAIGVAVLAPALRGARR